MQITLPVTLCPRQIYLFLVKAQFAQFYDACVKRDYSSPIEDAEWRQPGSAMANAYLVISFVYQY